MNRKILVTGGAGFIGSNFIHYWLNQHPEDRITNLDALTYAGNLASLKLVEDNPNYSFVQGDINDHNLVDKLMADTDIVVHFAAESHVDRSIKNPDVFLQTNVLGTHNLLRHALKHKVKRFHHVSTDEVFGSLKLGSTDKFSEETPYDPRSPYSASKAGSDHIVRAYGETYGLNYTISNCSNNYGPYQFPEKFISLAITNLIDDQPVPIYGDGQYVRDWLFVTDHCTAIEKMLLEDISQTTYVVGGLTTDIPNMKVIKMILEIMHKSENMLEHITDRPGHDRRYAVDWTKINQDLGWQPSVSFQEGLVETINWYQSNQDWWRPLKEKSAEYFADQYKQPAENKEE